MSRRESVAARAPAQPPVATVWPAVIVTDPGARVIHWSTAAEALYGWAAVEAVGRPLVELIVEPTAYAPGAEIMETLSIGVGWNGAFRVRHKDGHAFDVSIVNAPLLASDGTVVGIVGLSVPDGYMLAPPPPVPPAGRGGESDAPADPSALRLGRLQRIARSLSGLLTPEAVADVILHEVAPQLGGAGRALWLVDADRTHLELVRPEDNERARPFSRLPIGSDLPGPVAVRTGRPIFIGTKAERDAKFPALLGAEPMVAIAVVPLFASGRVAGVLALSHDTEHDFSPDERRFFTAVADLASQALERGRLHGRQVELARSLQRTLLPPDLPSVAGVELAAAYHPAWEGSEVGGDFYDVFALPGDDGWLAMIGDVCGTGPDAAAITAQVRHTVRTAARLGTPLRDLAAVVNASLVDSVGTESFCTMVAAMWRHSGEHIALDLVNAGHPHPLVVRATGAVEHVTPTGPLLGVFAEPAFETVALTLTAGDALLLCTDGVVEARSAEADDGDRHGFFGVSRLAETAAAHAGAPAAAIVAGLEAALLAYTGGRLADDVAMLAVRVGSSSTT